MKNAPAIRYNPPSKYDVASHGMIFKVMGENESFELFVQCSSNLDAPDWKPISYLLEKTFKELLEDPSFISLCLALSFGKPEEKAKHLKNMSQFLIK